MGWLIIDRRNRVVTRATRRDPAEIGLRSNDQPVEVPDDFLNTFALRFDDGGFVKLGLDNRTRERATVQEVRDAGLDEEFNRQRRDALIATYRAALRAAANDATLPQSLQDYFAAVLALESPDGRSR